MTGQGLSPEKIQKMEKDGIWRKLKRDWTEIYIADIEDDLEKEHGWLLRKETSDDELERGMKRLEELEKDVGKWREEGKIEIPESKKEPDLYDI